MHHAHSDLSSLCGRTTVLCTQVMRNNSMGHMEVSVLKTTYQDRTFDAHGLHGHHMTAPQQCFMQRRPPTRAIGQKYATRAPRRHARRPRAEHCCRHFGRARFAPHPTTLIHAKDLAEMRQRMSGLLMDSKKRSRTALPKSEHRVSNEQALTARDKEATMWPSRAG